MTSPDESAITRRKVLIRGGTITSLFLSGTAIASAGGNGKGKGHEKGCGKGHEKGKGKGHDKYDDDDDGGPVGNPGQLVAEDSNDDDGQGCTDDDGDGGGGPGPIEGGN